MKRKCKQFIIFQVMHAMKYSTYNEHTMNINGNNWNTYDIHIMYMYISIPFYNNF